MSMVVHTTCQAAITRCRKVCIRNGICRLKPRKVFNQSTTGELPKGLARADSDGVTRSHYWSGPRGEHGIYNEAVAELSENFMSERNINPESMTPDQARDLLKAIR